MMTIATLLHRETCSKSSLKQMTERAMKNQSNGFTYRLTLNANQLLLKACSSNESKITLAPDEGFESDIDSISLVSTESVSKSRETDSANGSSDSDLEQPRPPSAPLVVASHEECFNLVNCVCYTDMKYENILVFNVHSQTQRLEQCLIFRFDSVDELNAFHANFSTVKAVANQKRYQSVKIIGQICNFNLLQRTDVNGITHIRISNQHQHQQPQANDGVHDEIAEPTSIISLNAPEVYGTLQKSASNDDLLSEKEQKVLRKVWSSAENILDENISKRSSPKRRAHKGPAPQPPQSSNKTKTNVLQGEYVRVQVDKKECYQTTTCKAPLYEAFKFSDPKNLNGYNNSSNTEKSSTSHCYKYSEVHPKVVFQNYCSLNRANLKKAEESKGFHLSSYLPHRFKLSCGNKQQPTSPVTTSPKPTFSNRLFGMSAKLKELSLFQSDSQRNFNNGRYFDCPDRRFYSSLGNIHAASSNDGNGTLKSVIKKKRHSSDELKRKEKKVTFSAYNTVQVV